MSSKGSPFSEEVTDDVNNEPSKGRKSFPGRGSGMISGPKVARRNEVG